ncbi:hypothetical protein LEP1GSC060_3910 [Leptospira weilii serovar Ranarum str. ICFT]|uniref:Uncharacterized protein n=1 Tax=Leptospira weilii serovar Ranarum str. ICFT TaxID=1218598 RepID=N1WE60_9LEPT|nr:hypothetical protein LEP1GSC060_3910 [Leptospira weilii serovar Ranarum str. ICFT]
MVSKNNPILLNHILVSPYLASLGSEIEFYKLTISSGLSDRR